MLQEERVQFRNLPKYNHLADGEESHIRAVGIEPTHMRPTNWSELENGSLQFTCRRSNISAHKKYTDENKFEKLQFVQEGNLGIKRKYESFVVKSIVYFQG